MSHGLNKRSVQIANASGYGTAWTLTESGQLTTEGLAGYVESIAWAAVQPLGAKRNIEDAGTQIESGYKMWFYRSADGTFPTVRGGPDLPGDQLPTLVQVNGHWYEVQIVKDWTRGLLPHIYAEAELLGLTRPATAETTEIDGEGTPVTVEW